jgi:signal transduction histidine kinase
VPTAWTDALEPLRACVMRANKTAQFAAQRREETRLPTFPGMATTVKFSLSSPLEDSLPGFVMPLEDVSGLANVQRYRVVLLDLDYLEHKWLPALVQKHLLKQGEAEYAFAIFKRGERAMPLYDSEPTQKQSWAVSDLTQTLGKVKPQEPDHMFIKLPEVVALPGMPINKDQRRATSIRIESFTTDGTTLRTEEKNIAVPHPTASPTAPQAQAFIVAPRDSVTMTAGGPNDGKRATMINELLQNVLQNKPDGPWQLVIKHRAGSLDAAVAQVRHRNLAISFGVLALLGLSLALLAIASRRAQTLAHRQLEFVAGVSHELRTPLAVICSAAENLADGVVDNREQIKQYGTLIRDEGRRLGGMVEQVLEFAGAQSGKRTYDLRQVNAQAVIEDALAALQLPIVEQGFTVEAQLPASLPAIQADQAALSRALQNLLTNAMKYSGENRWISLRGEVRGNELLLTVQDRGLGIPADELSHLGEAFYRGKEVVAAQIHGNGLGLSLVKHILQVHGGRLSVASKVGQGSAFTMHLPLAVASAKEHSPLAAVEAE